MGNSIAGQFDNCVITAETMVNNHIVREMVAFGDMMIDSVLPSQAEFRNLTGNTLTSYAYAVYLNSSIHTIGLYSGTPAIRLKLVKNEVVRGFEDYDGNMRNYFRADIDTDKKYGSESSYKFLTEYKPSGKFSIIFTTGTEYSAYLENVLNLNVLSDGFGTVRSDFLRSFKPI